MTQETAPGLRFRTRAAITVGAMLVLFACRERVTQLEQPPEAPNPQFVVRDPPIPPGCPDIEVFVTADDTSEIVTTTFTSTEESCYPTLAAWGIDMADVAGVDTPAANAPWAIRSSNTHPQANSPSPGQAAEDFLTPPQGFIEIDPPARKVEFYYSRLLQQSAIWNGQTVSSDSMRVRAMRRLPGTTFYTTYDTQILHSNVLRTTPPWDVWTHVTLTAPDTLIGLVWMDGHTFIDDLTITRTPVRDTTFRITLDCQPIQVVRASEVSCEATWTPTTIQANEIFFKWSFEGDSVGVFPSPDAQKFPPPQPILDSAQAMTTWVGPVVLDGLVRVEGSWQGEVEVDSSELLIQPRGGTTWGNLPVLFSPDTADIPVDSTHTFLDTINVGGENYDTIMEKPGIAGMVYRTDLAVDEVQAGPNEGLWFVSVPGVSSHRGVRVNTWLTGRHAAYYDYSHSPDTLTNRSFLQFRFSNANGKGPKMHKNDSTELLSGIWAHETYGQGGGRGHQGEIEYAATLLNECGKVPTILERVVAEESFPALQRTIFVTDEGAKALAAASWHDRVFGNYVDAPYYRIADSTIVADTLTPFVALGDMMAQSPYPGSQPDSLWGCTRTF